MTDTLTQLISKVQSILGDTPGAIFSTATCTAAIRQALTQFNRRAPQLLTLTIPGDSDQLIYNLTTQDPTATKVLNVLIQSETNIPLTFDDYIETEHLLFRLRSPVSPTETLIIRYTSPHTISGLDGATASTLPAHYDQIIVTGAAYWAIHTRATSRVEMINMTSELTGDYAQAMQAFRSTFESGLSEAARRPTSTGEPDPHAWNDPYHSWDQ